MSAKGLSFTLDAFAAGIPGKVEQFHRAIGIEALTRVVLKTPVDEGRARGNWQVSNGAPAAGEVEQVDPSGAAAIAAGTATINEAKAFSETHVTNNVPYIVKLNDGHSQQAPQGMVGTTMDELRTAFGGA